MLMSPFLDLFSHSTRNLGRTRVCTYTNHQTQRFQISPSENSTFQLKNCVWTEPLLNRCIFSSLSTSIFWIKWIAVIISAIFSTHISRNCWERLLKKETSPISLLSGIIQNTASVADGHWWIIVKNSFHSIVSTSFTSFTKKIKCHDSLFLFLHTMFLMSII